MFIYNKKSGNIQECHNADAIKVCRKDTDHYLVAATREELEGKAANKPQEGLKKSEAGENTKEPEKAAPEGAEKLTEGNGEQQAAGGNAEGGEKQQEETGEGSGKPEEGAGEEKTGNDPLNGAGDERLAELNGKKVAELREIAKGMGIQGYANMNKDTLVAMIMNH